MMLRIGISRQQYQRLESKGNPRLGTLELIAKGLNSELMLIPKEKVSEVQSVLQHGTSELSNMPAKRFQDKENRSKDILGRVYEYFLGQFASATSATALVTTFNSSTLEIKVEAARALLRIAEPQIPHLVDLLKNSNITNRDGISWALARTGNFNPLEILPGTDDNLRKWISYMVGYGKENFVQADVEAICNADPEVYFAASVLWQIVASWVYDLKEY